MIVAIFVVLCLILVVLVLMLPADKQQKLVGLVKSVFLTAVVIVGVFFAVTFAYSLIVGSGGIVAAWHRIPWWVYVVFVALGVGFGAYQDHRNNRRIRAGDQEAINDRIEVLMKEHKYSRPEAEDAVERLRGKP